jgi:hypothetical protein
VERALAQVERQGSFMAHVAHACATLLLCLFSAGSLVALGSDALVAIERQWQQSGTWDVPSAISISVSTLMVLAMDVGMLYPASMLRLLRTRGAERSEKWLHQLVVAGVSVLEAATYAYMSWRFETPTIEAAWALILARAAAAPLVSVYLSMAQRLPIQGRDILYQVEVHAGVGVVHDVIARRRTAARRWRTRCGCGSRRRG